MNTHVAFGLLFIAALVLGGLALTHAVGAWAHPRRLRLYAMAQKLIEDPRTRGEDREVYGLLLDNATSFQAGWIVPRALLRTLRRYVSGSPPVGASASGLTEKERVVGLFALSVVLANPLAFLLSVPLASLLVIAGLARHQRPRAALEADMRDIASLSPGLCRA